MNLATQENQEAARANRQTANAKDEKVAFLASKQGLEKAKSLIVKFSRDLGDTCIVNSHDANEHFNQLKRELEQYQPFDITFLSSSFDEHYMYLIIRMVTDESPKHFAATLQDAYDQCGVDGFFLILNETHEDYVADVD